MTSAQKLENMSPELLKVVERAKERPEERFTSLAHLIDVPALTRVYDRIRKGAAVGVDGVTKEDYGQELGGNLQDLHERLKSKQYRHQPIRRVHIPKEGGRTRPIGISAFEDKLVQGAVRDVLEAIYEQDFLNCSYGFRPGRSAHDAVRSIDRGVHRGEMRWILEADIASFFDSIDRKVLMEMLHIRVADKSLLRLVGKCLHVGVLDGEELSSPDIGTAQGSALSPLLGNVYLHYVLDLWFEQEVRPRIGGRAMLVRYADDFIVCIERRGDAERMMEVLPKRMGRYGLTLHPDKTRLVPFGRPPAGQTRGKGPGTFDFLGFTFYWGRSQKGRWCMRCKTRLARRRRAAKSIADWCRRHRHLPVAVQHVALKRRIQGHFNYYGVSGNFRWLLWLVEQVRRSWHKWLRRRSQRTRLTWKRYAELLERFPLPQPQIKVRIWGS
ncbi:MAG: group II intron reverse transcriptase/maturase [Myxococcota bacterium]